MKAKVFMSGNSQAVRLPKEFRFDTDEVEIFRRDGDVVLRAPETDMHRAVSALRELSALIELPDDPPPEPVSEL